MNCQSTGELFVHLIVVASFHKTTTLFTNWMALTRSDIQAVNLSRYSSKYSYQYNIVKNPAKKLSPPLSTPHLLVTMLLSIP